MCWELIVYLTVSTGLTFLWKFKFYLKDCCCSSCKFRSSQLALGSQQGLWVLTLQKSDSVPVGRACLCSFACSQLGKGLAGLAYTILILSCHFPWVECPAMWCPDTGSRTRGSSFQCHDCQMHYPQDVKSRESDFVIGRCFSLWSLRLTLIQRQAVGSYFGFDANVNHSLSGTLSLWLTYLLLTIQGEPCSPLRYVALCLKTTFSVRIECGILFQVPICLGIFLKTHLRILQASLDWQHRSLVI